MTKDTFTIASLYFERVKIYTADLDAYEAALELLKNIDGDTRLEVPLPMGSRSTYITVKAMREFLTAKIAGLKYDIAELDKKIEEL